MQNFAHLKSVWKKLLIIKKHVDLLFKILKTQPRLFIFMLSDFLIKELGIFLFLINIIKFILIQQNKSFFLFFL